MRFAIFTRFSLALLLSYGVHAEADLDPASPLLKGSGKSPSLENLDTGRFTVKPVRSPRSNPAPVSIAKPEADKGPAQKVETSVKTSNTETTTQVEVNPTPPSPPPALAAPQPEPETATTAIVETPATQESKPTGTESDLTFMEKLRLLILGATDDELLSLRAKEKVKCEGQNILEIELSPTYFYYSSSSSYAVRRQSASSPGFTGGLSVWVSPYFAIQAQSQNSLGASISDYSTGAISTQTFSKNRFGVAFRSIDLDSNESAQTSWGVAYTQVDSSIAGTVRGRVKTQSSGVSISFDAKIPSSPNYQHVLGVSIEPKLSHRESSGAQKIRSGTDNLSSAIAARLGGEVRFQRQNQIFWLLEHRYEKNLFKGQATFADPQTGITPDGVNVDQGLTLFSIGYRWGK